MATVQSGVPKGRTCAFPGSPHAKWTTLAARASPALQPRPCKRAMHWLICSAVRAARTAPATFGLPGRQWSAARTALPGAAAPPPGAPCPQVRISPARWSQPAPCSSGTATGGAIGAAERLGTLGLREHCAQDPWRQFAASCCRADRRARSHRRCGRHPNLEGDRHAHRATAGRFEIISPLSRFRDRNGAGCSLAGLGWHITRGCRSISNQIYDQSGPIADASSLSDHDGPFPLRGSTPTLRQFHVQEIIRPID